MPQPASSARASTSATPIIPRPVAGRTCNDVDIMTTAAPLSIMSMAAGKGTRMKSALPKVLQPLAGRPLLQHVLNTVGGLCADRTLLVVGYRADAVSAHVAS